MPRFPIEDDQLDSWRRAQSEGRHYLLFDDFWRLYGPAALTFLRARRPTSEEDLQASGQMALYQALDAAADADAFERLFLRLLEAAEDRPLTA